MDEEPSKPCAVGRPDAGGRRGVLRRFFDGLLYFSSAACCCSSAARRSASCCFCSSICSCRARTVLNASATFSDFLYSTSNSAASSWRESSCTSSAILSTVDVSAVFVPFTLVESPILRFICSKRSQADYLLCKLVKVALYGLDLSAFKPASTSSMRRLSSASAFLYGSEMQSL